MRRFVATAAAVCAIVLSTAMPARAVLSTGACTGQGTLGNTIYLPNVTKTLGGPDGWYTPFIVQNIGGAVIDHGADIDLEVSFYRFDTGALVLCRRVLMLSFTEAFAEDPNNDAELPDDTQFSVVVRVFRPPTSYASAVAVVNEQTGSGTTAQASAYAGVGMGSNSGGFGGPESPGDGATKLFLPNTATRFFGFDTPIIVQNVGAAHAAVSASFTSFDGTKQVALSFGIEPGRSYVVDPDFTAGFADGTQYSAVLTSNQPITAVVNQFNRNGAPGASSYNALQAQATVPLSWNGPLFTNGLAPPYGYSPAVIQNVGTQATTPRATVILSDHGAVPPVTIVGPSLAPGRTWVLDPRFEPALPKFMNAALRVEAVHADGSRDTAAQLAGIVLPSSDTTTMAYRLIPELDRRLSVQLPNVTRTLGGACGWSTPIRLTAENTSPLADGTAGARIEFRKFVNGNIYGDFMAVTHVNLVGGYAQVDPRDVTGLSDDTQYSVFIRGDDVALPGGGMAPTHVQAMVIEQACGGDNTMAYEGFYGY
jgi:hypothetical protein